MSEDNRLALHPKDGDSERVFCERSAVDEEGVFLGMGESSNAWLTREEAITLTHHLLRLLGPTTGTISATSISSSSIVANPALGDPRIRGDVEKPSTVTVTIDAEQIGRLVLEQIAKQGARV